MYSCTSSTMLLTALAIIAGPPSPLRAAGEPELLAAQRLEGVADGCRALEVQVGRRLLHLRFQCPDVGIQLRLGSEGQPLVAWGRHRRIIPLVHAREHVV